MQKRLALLWWAFVALISFNQAHAQSSHDAVTDHHHHRGDYDLGYASSDGNYRIRFHGHVQENNRFSYDPVLQQRNITMNLNQARFAASGNVITPRLTYMIQTAFENDKEVTREYTAPGSRYLADFYFNFACMPRYFDVRVGKFSTPFSRLSLMPQAHMQFYANSGAHDEFQITNGGSDVGLMLHNHLNHNIEWAFAAVSNGLIARVGYNHGIDNNELTDFSGGRVRYAVAANGFYHTDLSEWNGNDLRAGLDYLVKVHSFSSNGMFYYQHAKQEGKAEGNNNFGASADFGYLINKKIEPVGRYSWTRNRADQSVHQHEILAGLNYYIFGNNLKVQSYAGTNLGNKKILGWQGGVQFQFALLIPSNRSFLRARAITLVVARALREPVLRVHPLGKNLEDIRDRSSKIFNNADGLLKQALF